MGQMQVTNNDFAEVQNEMQLCSFYEGLKTELDDFSAFVLKRASAIIGMFIFLPTPKRQPRGHRFSRRAA